MTSLKKEVLKYFFKGFIILVIISGIFNLVEILKETPPEEPKEYWFNIDRTKPATDISGYDYENRLIIYRDYTPSQKSKWSEIKPETTEELDIEQLIDLYID